MATDTAAPSPQRDSATASAAASVPTVPGKRAGLGATLKEKLTIRRSAGPYFVASFLAAVAMGWYFFLYVPQKLEYFVGLRFRTLAVASGQIKSKAESLGASLNIAPAPPPEPAAAAKEGDTEKYLRLLVPDIRLEQPGAGRSPGLQLVVDRRESDTAADKRLRATVLWEHVASQAAAATTQEFDDLVLADASGRVVWQREKTTPRLGNLTELLYAEDDKGTLLSPSWAIRTVFPAVDAQKALPKTASLKPIRVGSTSALMLVQALHLDSPQITDPAQTTLYAAGFVSRSRLQQQAMRIPLAWLVVLWLPIAILFLALPFIKLATMQAKERFSAANLVLMVFGAIATAGLGAVIPTGPRSVSGAGDRVLADLATLIDSHLGEETRAVLELAAEVVVLGAAPPALTDCEVESTEGWWGSLKLCDLWAQLAKDGRLATRRMPELDVAIWINDRGEQVRKWTTKAQLTGKAPHSGFEHFQNLTSNTLWTLNGARSIRFTIEPLRAPTTAELGTVFAMPLSELPDPQSVRDASTAEARFLALNVRPRSVVDAVMPPGYGFAIIAPEGRVLFHSTVGLSLEENFFEEVSNAQSVRERMQTERAVSWSGDYHGTPHRIHMQPVNTLIGSRWKVITFQDLNPVLAGIVSHQTGIFRLIAFGWLLLLVLALVAWGVTTWRGRTVSDFLTESRSPNPRRLRGLVVLMPIALIVLAAIGQSSAHQWANILVLFFVLLPFAAFGVSLYARLPEGPAGPVRGSPLVSCELPLLILLVGALPAAGFARIVHRVQDAQATEAWLEIAHQRLVAHDERAGARANSPAYLAGTRIMLTTHPAFAGGADPTMLHSYLSAAPISADVASPARCTHSPDTGQELVRGLLSWTLFSSDRRGHAEVMACAGSNQLQIPGRDPRLAAMVWSRSARPGATPDLVPAPGAGLWRWLAALLEWGRWLIAMLIVVGTIVTAHWAKRRLTMPAAVGAATLDDVLQLVESSDGNQGIMLIGPPRTRKDQDVRDRVLEKFPEWKQLKKLPDAIEPIYRIKLLDTTIDAAFVQNALDEVYWRLQDRNLLQDGERLWIHVSNLEAQLTTDKNRAAVLELLEKLLDRPVGEPSRVVVVTTSVDPIAHFQEIFTNEREGIYDDNVPEVELSRSSLLLSRFRRCYRPIATRKRADPWWDYQPERWPRTLVWEAAGYPPLREVAKAIFMTFSKPSDGDRSGPKQVTMPVRRPVLASAFRSQALATYDLLWESCTRCEKIVLVQLAQEGFVTTQNCEVVWSLINKGLIVERPRPAMFNNTFRQYVRRIEHDHIVEQWEREDGDGLWVVAGRLIASSLIAGGLFYLTTQDFSVDSLLPVVSGTGMFGAPVLRALLARVTMRGAASVISS